MHLDHLVLTVADPRISATFYQRVLGLKPETKDGRTHLTSPDGVWRIHLHQKGFERKPHAAYPTPGSADLCFVSDDALDVRLEKLAAAGVEAELGPVRREGAAGILESVYFRDPDGNLLEWAQPVAKKSRP